MRYIKTFESIRSANPDMFPPNKPEDEPQVVPGFEDGTIDPADTKPWSFAGTDYEAESERYKVFLKVVKERNFTETQTEIVINLLGITHDYCMSISEFPIHMRNFLESELIGKYISDGFVDVMSTDIFDENYNRIEGIIEEVFIYNVSSHDCSALINFGLKDIKHSYNTVALNIIKIDK